LLSAHVSSAKPQGSFLLLAVHADTSSLSQSPGFGRECWAPSRRQPLVVSAAYQITRGFLIEFDELDRAREAPSFLRRQRRLLPQKGSISCEDALRSSMSTMEGRVQCTPRAASQHKALITGRIVLPTGVCKEKYGVSAKLQLRPRRAVLASPRARTAQQNALGRLVLAIVPKGAAQREPHSDVFVGTNGASRMSSA
jgi:hypothetical protein